MFSPAKESGVLRQRGTYSTRDRRLGVSFSVIRSLYFLCTDSSRSVFSVEVMHLLFLYPLGKTTVSGFKACGVQSQLLQISNCAAPLLPLLHAISQVLMRKATCVGRDQLVSLGTCIGKFTKGKNFRLTVTSLDLLAAYAQCKVRTVLSVHLWHTASDA